MSLLGPLVSKPRKHVSLSIPRQVSVGSIAVAAVGLFLVHLSHLQADEELVPIVLGVGFPLGFSLLLGWASYVLWKSSLSRSGAQMVAESTALGSVLAIVMEGVAIVYRHYEIGDQGFSVHLGHEFYVLLTFGTIGALVGWLLGWSFAHRKREHQLLEETNKALREQKNDLAEVTAILSHDLRNPLSVASGRIDLLDEEVDSKHAKACKRALTRIDSIITDTLQLARQDRDIGDQTTVELATLSREAWEMVETGSVDLEVASTGSIRADRARLQEAFENLFRNAIDHGGETLETVRVGIDGEVLYVEDDGVGICHQQREEIFETGMTTEPDGTGLGLSIVEKVVSAHGWEVQATAGSQNGARFEIVGIGEE